MNLELQQLAKAKYAEGTPVDEIARYFKVRRITVAHWLGIEITKASVHVPVVPDVEGGGQNLPCHRRPDSDPSPRGRLDSNRGGHTPDQIQQPGDRAVRGNQELMRRGEPRHCDSVQQGQRNSLCGAKYRRIPVWTPGQWIRKQK